MRRKKMTQECNFVVRFSKKSSDAQVKIAMDVMESEMKKLPPEAQMRFFGIHLANPRGPTFTLIRNFETPVAAINALKTVVIMLQMAKEQAGMTTDVTVRSNLPKTFSF